MAIVSTSAHVRGNDEALPADVTFCLLHAPPDFWKSGKILKKTSTSVSTCNPSAKTFTLFVTASEITAGLKKKSRIQIDYDDAGTSEEKRITRYVIQPPTSYTWSVRVPGFTASAVVTFIDPRHDLRPHHGLLRLLPRIKLESELVLLGSFRFFSGAGPVAEADEVDVDDVEHGLDSRERRPCSTVDEQPSSTN